MCADTLDQDNLILHSADTPAVRRAVRSVGIMHWEKCASTYFSVQKWTLKLFGTCVASSAFMVEVAFACELKLEDCCK